MPFDSLDPLPFAALTNPAPADLGRGLESKANVGHPVLQLRFGEVTAGLPLRDVWSACCELLLAAQLVREERLNRFVLDLEHVFDVSSAGGAVFCRFSPEHEFAVARDAFADSLESLVAEIFAGTSCPRLMHIAACWGASSIRALPYSYRFSDSLLM
jgi:hypothetical protein